MSDDVQIDKPRRKRRPTTATREGVPAPDHHAVASLVERVAAEEALIVEMTPGLALALLERNRKNRRVSSGRVEVYARDMAAGRWRVNNQGIALGVEGDLYDGQHRLLAVVQANMAVRMLVMRGLSADARTTIDQGRARTVGDTLRILDGRSNGAMIVSWFRSIELLVSNQTLPLSHGMVQEQLARYEASVNWFVANVPRRRDLSRAGIVGALLYAHRVAQDSVERFTMRYLRGVDLCEGSPALALRNYAMQRMRLGADSNRAVSLKTLRCVLADLRGETISRISLSEDALEYFRALHLELDGNCVASPATASA